MRLWLLKFKWVLMAALAFLLAGLIRGKAKRENPLERPLAKARMAVVHERRKAQEAEADLEAANAAGLSLDDWIKSELEQGRD